MSVDRCESLRRVSGQAVEAGTSRAFEAYASGEWTVRDLAAELALHGLDSSPTPARPAKVIEANQLHKMLRNPYYKGSVQFQGRTYPGRHEPITDEVTWQRVQDVLSGHVVGEKVRLHHYYLKGSVYCGDCKSRLLVHHARNRHGTVYEYFICSGRHEKRNDRTAPAVPIALVERWIVDLYQAIALDHELRAQLEQSIRGDLRERFEDQHRLRNELVTEQARLQNRGRKLLDSHLDGLVPAELYAEEQGAINRQLATIAERLSALAAGEADLEANLAVALTLAEDCYEAYRRAPDELRRRFNQAFFKRITVHQDFEVTVEGEVGRAVREHRGRRVPAGQRGVRE